MGGGNGFYCALIFGFRARARGREGSSFVAIWLVGSRIWGGGRGKCGGRVWVEK